MKVKRHSDLQRLGRRRWKSVCRIVAAALALLLAGTLAAADTARLPDVTEAMTDAAYWAEKAEQPDSVLADAEEIEALNAGFLACEDCRMTNLRGFCPGYDGIAFQRELLKNAMKTLSDYLDPGYFNAEAQPTPYGDMAAILETIDGAETSDSQRVRYGVCVTLANVRAVPSDLLITDGAGDNDFDVLQMSYLRVGEPVIIRAQTADGAWFYCDSACVSGWSPARNIAVCANRREWLNAWQFPAEEALVVTEGKLYLDDSNVNAAASRRMLTMGTVLRRVRDEDFDPAVTNRAAYQNYPVYLPARDEDGGYTVTQALIPQHSGVSEGFLPLTARNMLEVAFSMLGDAYGWGGMLAVPDCSLYVRNVYKCFGLELPRNTTWQSAMPALKYDMSQMEPAQKAALLDGLPPCPILFFRGHEMLYLGEAGGKHYVISTVSSMMTPDGESRLRVRSVVINTLEGTRRGNGNTWLEDMDLAVVPYLPQAEEEAGEAAEALAG